MLFADFLCEKVEASLPDCCQRVLHGLSDEFLDNYANEISDNDLNLKIDDLDTQICILQSRLDATKRKKRKEYYLNELKKLEWRRANRLSLAKLEYCLDQPAFLFAICKDRVGKMRQL